MPGSFFDAPVPVDIIEPISRRETFDFLDMPDMLLSIEIMDLVSSYLFMTAILVLERGLPFMSFLAFEITDASESKWSALMKDEP